MRRTKTSKAVVQIKDGKVIRRYSTIAEASKDTDISYQAITQVLKGRCRTSKGCTWVYYRDLDHNTVQDIWNNSLVDGRKKPVLQIKDGEIVGEFDSQKSAAEAMDRSPVCIHNAIHKKGRMKTSAGFEWEFKN